MSTALAPCPPAPATRFVLPADAEATGPPERRGIARDAVRLLAVGPGQLEHRHFRDLPALLDPGDLLVVNTSATLAAAVTGRRVDGRSAPVHVSGDLGGGEWVIEVRAGDGACPDLTLTSGEDLWLPGGLHLELIAAYPNPDVGSTRLWRAEVTPASAAAAYLARHGRPIGYSYLAGDYPLADHQTVFATQPGSAEMASAGRPFTAELVVRLIARGIVIAPIVLHAGVSSPEPHEPPAPERFTVPAATARLVEMTRAAGRRVVAVGTTATRALETAAGPDGQVRAAAGWTDLILGPDRSPRVVTGLVTGLHAPEASHLLLLEAVAGPELVGAAYDAAIAGNYLWHEFGDSMLFLPGQSAE